MVSPWYNNTSSGVIWSSGLSGLIITWFSLLLGWSWELDYFLFSSFCWLAVLASLSKGETSTCLSADAEVLFLLGSLAVFPIEISFSTLGRLELFGWGRFAFCSSSYWTFCLWALPLWAKLSTLAAFSSAAWTGFLLVSWWGWFLGGYSFTVRYCRRKIFCSCCATLLSFLSSLIESFLRFVVSRSKQINFFHQVYSFALFFPRRSGPWSAASLIQCDFSNVIRLTGLSDLVTAWCSLLFGWLLEVYFFLF